MMDHNTKLNDSKIQKMVRASRFDLTEQATKDSGKMENVMALVDF